MIGAIAGDIIGSVFEFNNYKNTDFKLFTEKSKYTDDTVLTAATAFAILKGIDYGETYRAFGNMYTNVGYGGLFRRWLMKETMGPYNSFGNGSAMRVSPVAYINDNLTDVLDEAKKCAEVTHSHSEGVKGAQATAAAIFWARTGKTKEEIRALIEKTFIYDLDRSIDAIRPEYTFNETCQGSVPEAIIAFLESNDFEHAIRLAISIGGDSDTIACITGSIAEAYYGGVPEFIETEVRNRLDDDLIDIVDEFIIKYHNHG